MRNHPKIEIVGIDPDLGHEIVRGRSSHEFSQINHFISCRFPTRISFHCYYHRQILSLFSYIVCAGGVTGNEREVEVGSAKEVDQVKESVGVLAVETGIKIVDGAEVETRNLKQMGVKKKRKLQNVCLCLLRKF